ncbi:hypothetical protein IAT38_006944 [Cryptococcus sp. DSM 104549]
MSTTPTNDKALELEDGRGVTVLAEEADQLIDWTPEEERRAVWKQIFIVMPLIILGFYSLQLDRGNITQALTSTLYEDVGITQGQMASGQSILLCMIVLFEIPSNIILINVGAKWWLSGQMIVWGVVATAQTAINSPATYYATRTLLGIAESGFIPGAVYYISTLFTRREQAKLVAWFYIGNICGKGSSGLIAYGVLPLAGKHGFAGWQWIFLIEGIMSIGIGFICLALLPSSSLDCRTLLGFRLFTERESHILHTRVILDDPTKEHPHSHFSKKNILLAVTQWRMWLHVIFCICGISCVTAVATYNAQVVKALGFKAPRSNALSSVGAWLQAPCTLAWGYMMDRTRFKGPLMLLSNAIVLILSGVYYSFMAGTKVIDKWGKFWVYQLLVAFGEPFFVGGLAWAQSTARTPIQRSMYAALYVMGSNSGQAIGGQMFRASDAPKYINGFRAVMGLQGFTFVVASSLIAIYVYSNKNNLGEAGKESTSVVRDPETGVETEIKVVYKYPT